MVLRSLNINIYGYIHICINTCSAIHACIHYILAYTKIFMLRGKQDENAQGEADVWVWYFMFARHIDMSGKTRELPMFLYFDSFLMEALFEHLLLLQCL